MAEHFKSITDARKALPELSQAAHRGMERCIITNQGKPQSVLMGYGEYLGLLAATELLDRPRDLASLERGLEQGMQKDALLTFDQVKQNLLMRQQLAQATAPLANGHAVSAVPQPPVSHAMDEIKDALGQIMTRLGIVAFQTTASPSPERPARRFAPLKDRLRVQPLTGLSSFQQGIVIPDMARAKSDPSAGPAGAPIEVMTTDQVLDVIGPSKPPSSAPKRRARKEKA